MFDEVIIRLACRIGGINERIPGKSKNAYLAPAHQPVCAFRRINPSAGIRGILPLKAGDLGANLMVINPYRLAVVVTCATGIWSSKQQLDILPILSADSPRRLPTLPGLRKSTG